MVKNGSWLADLIEVYNQLGGVAKYSDVEALAKKIRTKRGATWTRKSDATIRRTVEDNSPDSDNFTGRNRVFYSVKGLGRGVWGLLPEYDTSTAQKKIELTDVGTAAYAEGIEGILRETIYLTKSRDRKLVEARKLKDDFTCQVCAYRKMIENQKYIIDVHHLNPIGTMSEIRLTSIDDLICLCPNCHRVAHSRVSSPLTVDEIRTALKSN